MHPPARPSDRPPADATGSDVSVPQAAASAYAPVDPSPFARIDCRLAFHLGPGNCPEPIRARNRRRQSCSANRRLSAMSARCTALPPPAAKDHIDASPSCPGPPLPICTLPGLRLCHVRLARGKWTGRFCHPGCWLGGLAVTNENPKAAGSNHQVGERLPKIGGLVPVPCLAPKPAPASVAGPNRTIPRILVDRRQKRRREHRVHQTILIRYSIISSADAIRVSSTVGLRGAAGLSTVQRFAAAVPATAS